jgi:hypothetical protein
MKLRYFFAVLAILASSLVISPARAADTVTWREGDVRFKVTCNYSHSAPDDPIVHPGMPGMAHQHDFTGNRTTNAYSTFTSLKAGTTTCNDPADLSPYWTPGVTIGSTVRLPDRATAYYRRGAKVGNINPYPADLRIIAESGQTGWMCNDSNALRTTTDGCTTNLTMKIEFPDCIALDAQGLPLKDSANHRSHMAYATGGDGNTVPNRCPATHPYQVPELSITSHYGNKPSMAKVTLSSEAMGQWIHADFWNVWDDARQEALIEYCLEGLRKCDSGGASIPG